MTEKETTDLLREACELLDAAQIAFDHNCDTIEMGFDRDTWCVEARRLLHRIDPLEYQ